MIPAAFAAVEVTYTFNEQNVSVQAYNCLDSACSNVAQFGGLVNGSTLGMGSSLTTNNGEFIITYPNTLQSSGYALFFTSPGYLPIEWKSTLHTGGRPGLAKTTTPISFTRTSNTCRAPITGLEFEQTLETGELLTVDASAALDATTGSAFELFGQGIDYIPQSLIPRYYSVDTDVILEVLLGGQVVYTDTHIFNWTQGNALFAGTNAPASFTFNPQDSGNYTIKVTSQITDDQCSDTEDQDAQGELTVMDVGADDYCYALVDFTRADTSFASPGKTVAIDFGITSRKVGGANPGPLQAQATYDVTQGGSSLTGFPQTIDLGSTPANRSFTFTPTSTGTHTVEISATPNSAACNALETITDDKQITIQVQGTNEYDLTVYVKDSKTGAVITTANVTVNGTTEEVDANGLARFNDLTEGHYTIISQADGYPQTTKHVNLHSDKSAIVYMRTDNSAPVMRLPANIKGQVDKNITLDLTYYTTDDHDLAGDLTYNTSHGQNLNVDLTNGVATIEPLTGGTHNIYFNATDSQGLTGADTIQVIINAGAGDAPELRGLPDVQMQEDNQAIRVIDLYDFTDDDDTPNDMINFTAQSNNSDMMAFIENNRYVSIIPGKDKSGLATITITATDGQDNDQEDFELNVTPVNDAPRAIRTPVNLVLNESTNVTINLTTIFDDVDTSLTALDYTVHTNANDVQFELDGTNFTIIPDQFLNGDRAFNLTATDNTESPGGSATAEFTLTIDPINDAPEIVNFTITELTLAEESTNSIDLTAFEDDDEDGPGANNNDLTWSITGTNSTLYTHSIDTAQDFLEVTGNQDQVGEDEVTLWLTDSSGLNTSVNITIKVTNVNDAPVLHNIEDKQAQIGTLFTYQINATDIDTMDTLSYFDNTSLLAIDEQTGLINETLTIAGMHDINITVCDDSGASNNCTTENFTLTVSDTDSPTISNISEPTDPSFFVSLATQYEFSALVTDNGQIDAVTLDFNGTTYDNPAINGDNYSFAITNLTPGVYSYQFHANDTEGNAQSSTSTDWTLNKAASNITLALDGSASNITIQQNDTVDIIGTLVNPAAENITLSITGESDVSGASPLNTNVTKATAGIYAVTASFAGNANFSSSDVTYHIIVNDSTAPQFSNEDITPANNSLAAQDYHFEIDIADNLGVANVTFTFNGTQYAVSNPVGNNYEAEFSDNLTAGDYTYEWSAEDAAGNSATFTSTYTVAPDTTAPTFSNANNPANPTPFAPNYTFTINVADDVAVNEVLFEIDGSNMSATRTSGDAQNGTYSVTVGPFAAGTHDYQWHAEDTSGNANSTSTETLNISQGTPSITLTINGIDADTSVPVNDTVEVIATLTNPPGGDISVEQNGMQIYSGASPYADNFTFSALGTQNFTAIFAGNANVSAGNVTRTLTIVPQITKTNISPADATHFNLSSFTLTLDTTGTTSCAWSASDVAQQQMNGTFTTANGLAHEATITGLDLGSNSIHVACNNESASSNTDLTYTADNILDGTTLNGANNIDATIMTNSIIEDSNLTDTTGKGSQITDSDTSAGSQINDSIVTRCTLVNTTVLDSIVSDCNLINAYIDPSNVTGSTITGGQVIDSNVIDSTSTNSFYTDANVRDSTVSGSTITNSTFEDATVDDATIINDVIQNGSITVGGTNYDADTQGAANLSDVVPVPPQASFTPTNTGITKGNTVSFTSTTTDDNIGGPLGDNLTYLWTFGDGSNSADENPSHTYTSTGTFTVTLTVTDSAGLTDTATGTVTVSSANPQGGGVVSGGGGGGGGGGGAKTIEIGPNPLSVQLRMGQPLYFKINGRTARTSAYFRKVNTFEDIHTAEFMVNGRSYKIPLNGAQEFDVTQDNIADLEIRVSSIESPYATLIFAQPGLSAQTGLTGLLPNFNFDTQPQDSTGQADEPSLDVKEPEQVGQTENVVDVEANVGGNMFSALANKIKSLIGATAQGMGKVAIIFAIIILGLLGYMIANRFMD